MDNPCKNCIYNIDEYCRCEKLTLYETYYQGAREFAEWLIASYIVSDVMGDRMWADELLYKWQKGVKND